MPTFAYFILRPDKNGGEYKELPSNEEREAAEKRWLDFGTFLMAPEGTEPMFGTTLADVEVRFSWSNEAEKFKFRKFVLDRGGSTDCTGIGYKNGNLAALTRYARPHTDCGTMSFHPALNSKMQGKAVLVDVPFHNENEVEEAYDFLSSCGVTMNDSSPAQIVRAEAWRKNPNG